MVGGFMKNLKDYGLETDKAFYVIAEIGINHGGSLSSAKKLIDSAIKTGCDAVKFQTYITEKRAPKGKKEIFDILKSCELEFSDFKIIKDYCDEKGITFFSTPFDDESVDYLESIKCPIYKIASFDTVNIKLIEKINSTGKPVIMSVGMSTTDEIMRAYDKIQTPQKALLHCISSYPTNEEDSNLSCIANLKELFQCPIGHSDHTSGIEIPLFAAAAGAQIIEKHYKINDRMECVDSPVSITESQMTKLVNELDRLSSIFGKGNFGIRKSEEGATIFRRFN